MVSCCFHILLDASTYHKIIVYAVHCMKERRKSPQYDVVVEWSLESCEELDGWRRLNEKYGENI